MKCRDILLKLFFVIKMNAIILVGLQLLLSIHISVSFVLLTANIDDVKKLAMKFVSESFADKIGDLLTQAAAQMIHSSNEATQDVSAENKEYIPKESSSEYADKVKAKKRLKEFKHFRKQDAMFDSNGSKKARVQYAYLFSRDNNKYNKSNDYDNKSSEFSKLDNVVSSLTDLENSNKVVNFRNGNITPNYKENNPFLDNSNLIATSSSIYLTKVTERSENEKTE